MKLFLLFLTLIASLNNCTSQNITYFFSAETGLNFVQSTARTPSAFQEELSFEPTIGGNVMLGLTLNTTHNLSLALSIQPTFALFDLSKHPTTPVVYGKKISNLTMLSFEYGINLFLTKTKRITLTPSLGIGNTFFNTADLSGKLINIENLETGEKFWVTGNRLSAFKGNIFTVTPKLKVAFLLKKYISLHLSTGYSMKSREIYSIELDYNFSNNGSYNGISTTKGNAFFILIGSSFHLFNE